MIRQWICLCSVVLLVWLTLEEGPLPASQAPSAQGSVELTRQGDTVEIYVDRRLFTTYYFSAAVAKPYFQPLRSAQGRVVTRDFPKGNSVPPDHVKDPSLEPHQRPLFFGHGNIDGLDFWGEAAFPKWGSYLQVPGSNDSVFGCAKFCELQEIRGGAERGRLRARFTLADTRGRLIADEIQSFVIGGNRYTRWIDCEIVLVANHGSDLAIGDTKEGTFGLRLAPELNSPPGHMVNSLGAEGEQAIWGKRADWVNYDGKVGGEDLGVAVFDSPQSFRHPTWWHARGYGLLAANPFGWREFYRDANKDGSWTVQQNKQLKFRYRVVIHHGDYRQARIAQAYQEYANYENTLELASPWRGESYAK